MGSGIAQVSAHAGLSVIMQDVTDALLNRGLMTIGKSLQRDVDKQRLALDEKQQIISRITPTKDLADLHDTDFVLEAITEDPKVKSELFKGLDQMVRPDVILASN